MASTYVVHVTFLQGRKKGGPFSYALSYHGIVTMYRHFAELVESLGIQGDI